MKKALFGLITTLGILAAVSSRAGVKVTAAPEPLEKAVAFRAPNDKFVTTVTGGYLTISGEKIGSKQTFTILDLNGTDLVDGDPVKIRYTPGGLKGDKSKSNYWVETPDGIKRNSEGSIFKIKVVDTKYAFLTPSGKFMTGITTNESFDVSDKQANALLLELVDLSTGIPKKPKKSQAEAPAAPTAEKPTAPATEKPAAE